MQLIADVLLYIVYGDDLGDDNTNKAEKKRKNPKASLCMELVMMIMLIMTILTELRKIGRTQRQVYARRNLRYSALLRAVARKKPESLKFLVVS